MGLPLITPCSGRAARRAGAGPATGGFEHALLWRSTAASVVDLNAFLPSGDTTAVAEGIDKSGDISGWALTPTGEHAILWQPINPSTLSAGTAAPQMSFVAHEMPASNNTSSMLASQERVRRVGWTHCWPASNR